MTEQNPQRTLTHDERAELESLRAQVAELREEVSRVDTDSAHPRVTKPARRRTWPRTTVGYILIALAALLAPLAVVSVWARSQVTDTDRYVETVAPLASDPAVQAAVTTNITMTTTAVKRARRMSNTGTMLRIAPKPVRTDLIERMAAFAPRSKCAHAVRILRT